MTTTSPHLAGCTGERLLLLRVLRPQLKGLIDQELECRGHQRRWSAGTRATTLRLVRPAKLT